MIVNHVGVGLVEARRVGLVLQREWVVTRDFDHGLGSPSTVAARSGVASGLYRSTSLARDLALPPGQTSRAPECRRDSEAATGAGPAIASARWRASSSRTPTSRSI